MCRINASLNCVLGMDVYRDLKVTEETDKRRHRSSVILRVIRIQKGLVLRDAAQSNSQISETPVRWRNW